MVTLLPVDCKVSSNNPFFFTQTSSRMKITKKKVRIQTLLVNLIIKLERPLEKIHKKGECIVIKRHNAPVDSDSGFYEINPSYYGGESPDKWLVWKGELYKTLNSQVIRMGLQM